MAAVVVVVVIRAVVVVVVVLVQGEPWTVGVVSGIDADRGG